MTDLNAHRRAQLRQALAKAQAFVTACHSGAGGGTPDDRRRVVRDVVHQLQTALPQGRADLLDQVAELDVALRRYQGLERRHDGMNPSDLAWAQKAINVIELELGENS